MNPFTLLGQISGAIHDAKVGDTMMVKGPAHQFAIGPNEFQEVAVVVGGASFSMLH
jgi:Na+-transporting NADH:ubiquinone oxidoreductase subunit NqrF